MNDFWTFILPWVLMGLGLWLGGCAVVLAYRVRELKENHRKEVKRHD